MIMYKRAETISELEQVLRLQRNNLPHVIASEEKVSEGFVTVRHTLKLLQEMNQICPHILAVDGHRVIGYALCMDRSFKDEIAILQPMFTIIKKAVRTASTPLNVMENYLVMGQICIDKDFRKQGVFRKLYQFMKTEVIPPYSAIITEVDNANTRSLQAHMAIGFKTLHTYQSHGQNWNLIYLS